MTISSRFRCRTTSTVGYLTSCASCAQLMATLSRRRRQRVLMMSDLRSHADGRDRCGWCGDDPLYVDYHDTEWGVGATDDNEWFEKVCLEGFQSGLSWI